MNVLDSRLNAYRSDLADIRLKGQVSSSNFVSFQQRQVVRPLIPVRKSPASDAMQLTQALLGETVKVFDDHAGWAWVQLDRDGYVGYIESTALSKEVNIPTHRVAVPSTFLYPAANLKSQPATVVTLNAQVTAVGSDGRFTELTSGQFIYTDHLESIDAFTIDFVSVAEMFLHVPYYWGGKSVHGLDCSGLVQLALQASGAAALRDSDMQEATLGRSLDMKGVASLKRGDLIFWDGHVGIMTNDETLLHANGHHMMVVAESLQIAATRIAQRYGAMTSIKRL